VVAFVRGCVGLSVSFECAFSVWQAARAETIRAAAQRAFDAEEKERLKRESEEVGRVHGLYAFA
jgi:hypothetical protein